MSEWRNYPNRAWRILPQWVTWSETTQFYPEYQGFLGMWKRVLPDEWFPLGSLSFDTAAEAVEWIQQTQSPLSLVIPGQVELRRPRDWVDVWNKVGGLRAPQPHFLWKE